MPPKKTEIALQREIETQEEWEEVLAKEGLWVIDVYQEWCGPCTAMASNFRRLRNELGDSLLNFAVAKADTIDALDRYRSRCEPCFLFYAGGILVSFVHGANAPLILRCITEQLAQEHKVLEGNADRKEVKDTMITRTEEKEMEKRAEEEARREAEDEEGEHEYESGEEKVPRDDRRRDRGSREPKGYTIALIKPDAVAAGKTEEIMEELRANGIEVIRDEERELSEEEAREFYSDLQEEDYFEELVKFISSGPSHVMVLTSGETGEDVVRDWRELIGPKDVEEAVQNNPECLRAKYGEKSYMNALHGSSSEETAARELAFFFPDLVLPTYAKKKENLQRTLAIIRPEAFAEHKDDIISKIEEAGFKIAMYKEITLTKEQAESFYKEHAGREYFDLLVERMSSGPLLALGLAKDDAVQAWRGMLGPPNVDEAKENSPDSMRAMFAAGDGSLNQFHGSDSEEVAKKEIEFFFPMESTVAVIKPDAMGSKEAIVKKIHEAGFRIAARKETQIPREVAEAIYTGQKGTDHYETLVGSITSGPTMFMVLSREDAVEGWRREIGPTDPMEARHRNPKLLRAKFGKDILHNALHGASNKEKAQEEMQLVFGNLEFNPDGTIKGEEPELDEATVDKQEDEPTGDETTAEETQGDTTVDETQADITTGDVTADETQDQTQTADATAEETEGDTTQEPTQEESAPQAETTGETTAAAAEPTTADETQDATADATLDETQEPTLDQTATMDETTGDATADVTADATADVTADGDTTQESKEPADQAESSPTEPEQTDDAAKGDDSKKAEPQAAESAPQKEEETKQEAKQEEKKDDGKDTDKETPTADNTTAEDSGVADAAPAAEQPAGEAAKEGEAPAS